MAAIITDQIRILNAKNFVAGVSTSTISYYSFVGLTDPTAILSDWDTDPPSPIDNFTNHNDFWDTAIALKKINSSDVKQVVTKNSWTSGTTYDYYRHDYSITNPPKHAQGTALSLTAELSDPVAQSDGTGINSVESNLINSEGFMV